MVCPLLFSLNGRVEQGFLCDDACTTRAVAGADGGLRRVHVEHEFVYETGLLAGEVTRFHNHNFTWFFARKEVKSASCFSTNLRSRSTCQTHLWVLAQRAR